MAFCGFARPPAHDVFYSLTVFAITEELHYYQFFAALEIAELVMSLWSQRMVFFSVRFGITRACTLRGKGWQEILTLFIYLHSHLLTFQFINLFTKR
jgi:hypothetical protein